LPKWLARSYEKGDEIGIRDLHNTLYPTMTYTNEQWDKYWHWMHENNPSGKSWIEVAETDSKIVGCSALSPVRMKVEDKVVLGFQSMNTMTHPDYQHQGIYRTLALRTYSRASRNRAVIGYRFPNKESHPIAVNRLGWIDVARPKVWFKVRGLLGSKAPSVPELTVTRVETFEDWVDNLWSRVPGQSRIMVVRSKAHLNWRYFSAPSVDYLVYTARGADDVVRGYMVFQQGHRGRLRVNRIFDILADSTEAAQHLITESVKHMEVNGANITYCGLVDDGFYSDALHKCGFRHMPLVKGGWFCAYSASPSVPVELIKDSGNWYIQTGDSDAN